MMKAKGSIFLTTAAGCIALWASSAQAYVRAVTATGVPLWWRSPCVTMEIYLGAPPPSMTADQYFKASQLAAQAWSHQALACTGLSISIQRKSEAIADVGLDYKNVIVFRQDSWCKDGNATDGPCYPSNALAVTADFKSNATGEIVDADMEINALSIDWADLVTNPDLANSSTADFQNTLTHELGHVIGLAHNCYITNDGPTILNDNTGNSEVRCANPDVPQSVKDATMYPVVAMSDTERRTLSPDDEQAVCDIYPDTGATCPPGSAQGCTIVAPADARPNQGWAFSLLAGIAGLLVALDFRRRSVQAK